MAPPDNPSTPHFAPLPDEVIPMLDIHRPAARAQAGVSWDEVARFGFSNSATIPAGRSEQEDREECEHRDYRTETEKSHSDETVPSFDVRLHVVIDGH
jgi:hypothetical protein